MLLNVSKMLKPFVRLFIFGIVILSYNIVFGKELVYIRHGHKLSHSENQQERNYYKKSERYKQNPADEPLTKIGQNETKLTADKLLKKIDINKHDYIYSSPMTRCLDTANIISDEVYEKTGKRLKIRVEYGLAETFWLYNKLVVTFEGEKFVVDDSGNYDPVIDEQLYFPALVEKHPNIDNRYRSFISDRSRFTTSNDAIQGLINTIKRLVNNNENIIIVGHGGGPYVYTHYYLTQEKHKVPEKLANFVLTGIHTSTNFVSIFKQNVKGNWEIKFGPKRII